MEVCVLWTGEKNKQWKSHSSPPFQQTIFVFLVSIFVPTETCPVRENHGITLQRVPLSWGDLTITLFSHSLTALTEVNSNVFHQDFSSAFIRVLQEMLVHMNFFKNLFLSFLESHICVALCYQNAETTIADSRMLHKIQLRCSGHQLCFHNSCNKKEKNKKYIGMGTFLQSSTTTLLFQSYSQLSTWLMQRSLDIHVLMYPPTVVMTLYKYSVVLNLYN